MKIKNKTLENHKMDTAIETVIDMITQRGYKITKSEEDKIIVTNSIGENIIVFTVAVVKLNVDTVKEYISILHKMEMKHCIVIYIDNVTSMTKKLIENSVDIKIEIFTQEELQYNITKHRLVPKHIRLSQKDTKEFKNVYGFKLPTILRTDPVSRFYDFNRGDIIKIIRINEKDKFVTYRIVK